MKALPEVRGISPTEFHASIRHAARPVVLRDLVAGWPVVAAAREGDEVLVHSLCNGASNAQVDVVRAAPEADGRLHYNSSILGPNFDRGRGPFTAFLRMLLEERGMERPETLAVQGLLAEAVLPGFSAAHSLPLLSPEIAPRLWIGNATKVATHNDPSENIACVAAGRRRFTLFPPEQVGNLYMGPFHVTPAGTPVSMVHLTDPDLDRYPRFAAALVAAQAAELGPGDAIYIPYGWYHHVEAIEPINLLVNYWWDPARRDLGSPWDVLMHGMMTLRQLPADQRHAWRAMFDHYVFLADGNPNAHLPESSRGVLAADTPADIAQMRRNLIAALQRAATEQ